ncbi:MAG: SufD family Fe-S cluster assembly protein [Pseudomonadota bacterium]
MPEQSTAEPKVMQLSNSTRHALHEVGFDNEDTRAGTSILVDDRMEIAQSHMPGIEIMPLAEALRTYDFVQDLMFGLVEPDANADIAGVSDQRHDPVGHFIWVKPGAKVSLPVQSFTMMATPQKRQFTHDITLIDQGAQVEMISGAAVPEQVHTGRHVSVHETYLRAGARCTGVTIERWGAEMETASYSYARQERGSFSRSTAIKLSTLRHDLSHSETEVETDATCISQSILLAPKDTERELTTKIRLTGPNARAEDVARMVTTGGRIVNDAVLIGESCDCAGYLGCDGLRLTPDGEISATPALIARAERAQLSHEASVGMIAHDKLIYLMAAGLDEDAARDLVVQGFLAPAQDWLPGALRGQIAAMIGAARSGGM